MQGRDISNQMRLTFPRQLPVPEGQALLSPFAKSGEASHRDIVDSRCHDVERDDLGHIYPTLLRPIPPRCPSASPRHSFLKSLASGMLLEHIVERYPVGVTTFTLPIPTRQFGRATYKENGKPALVLSEVGFAIYYPTEAGLSTKQYPYLNWVMRYVFFSMDQISHPPTLPFHSPISNTVKGFSLFFGMMTRLPANPVRFIMRVQVSRIGFSGGFSTSSFHLSRRAYRVHPSNSLANVGPPGSHSQQCPIPSFTL